MTDQQRSDDLPEELNLVLPKADDDWLRNVAGAALGHPPSLRATWAMTVKIVEEGIPGDLVECGVYAGVHPAVMARALKYTGATGRKVHLFDSFCGHPHGTEMDLDNLDSKLHGFPLDGAMEETGICACSQYQVKAFMGQWGVDTSLLVYHKGWFCDTVPGAGIDLISLLRIHGDLYESGKVCLTHLYPKISVGGFVALADTELRGGLHAVRDAVGRYDMRPRARKVPCAGGPMWWRILEPWVQEASDTSSA